MPVETLRVRGYREFVRACDHAGKTIKREVRSALRDVGDVVRAEAQRLFSSTDARSAAGYRVSVRQRSVAVVQSLRKTTGTRPDYGSLQMRTAFLPALKNREAAVERRMEHAIDVIADNFDS